MALPGDRACRPVGPCGAGTWGAIPVEASTQHVDGTYLGGGSDGSATKPWTTIQDAVDAAASGAIVAVAAGTYAENVRFLGKSVRLWGVCAELVEIAGPDLVYAALEIDPGVASAEVRGLAVSGPSVGVLTGSSDVLLEQVRVHSTGNVGIVVQGTTGGAGARIVDTLVEGAKQVGIYVSGGVGKIERTEVRDVQIGPQLPGIGVAVHPHVQTQALSSATVSASRVHRTHAFGMVVSGCGLVVDATSISDVEPNAAGSFGGGLQLSSDDKTDTPAEVTLTDSVIQRVRYAGLVLAGGDLSASGLTIRDIAPSSEGGRGVAAQLGDLPTSLTLSDSTIERASEVGVVVNGVFAELHGVLVADTRESLQGVAGQGLAALDALGSRANVRVTSSELTGNQDSAVVFVASDGELDGVLIRETQPSMTSMLFGRGLTAQLRPQTGEAARVTMRSSLVETNHEVGVYAGGSDITLEAVLVRGTTVSVADGAAGDGLAVVWAPSGGSAIVRGCVFANNARAGVAGFGTPVTIEGSFFDCNAFDLDGEEEAGQKPTFQLADNRCGCDGQEVACQIRTQNIAPPAPP
jgi:hypothetical protein